MLFPTLTFAIFFAVVLPACWLLMRRPLAWRCFMLAASYFFYGWWDWRFVGLLIVSTVANQALARGIEAADPADPARRRLITAAVAVNLGLLGFFKYYGFFVLSAESLMHRLGLGVNLPLLQIVLPVGISFFTFQAMSYVIDVYRGRIQTSTVLEFGVYLAFFPQLVAGPIVRASEFLPQLKAPRDPSSIDAARAFRLIGGGLFKKLVLADLLARDIVDAVFANPEAHSGPEILIGVYGYAVQIYCDFSAYSDIAIGVALLMGFTFPDNFNAPYAARSLQDFWRRWHMTLSRWLRDYLYISLGGSRISRLMTYRNLALTMLLGGLWHGASWMFVIWGAIHGGYLALERYIAEERDVRPGSGSAAWGLVQRFWIFHLVCLAWIFFRSPSMEVVGEVLRGLGRGWSAPPEVTAAALAAIAVGLATQAVPKGWLVRLEDGFSRLALPAQAIALAAGLMVIDALGPKGVAAFIYFQF